MKNMILTIILMVVLFIGIFYLIEYETKVKLKEINDKRESICLTNCPTIFALALGIMDNHSFARQELEICIDTCSNLSLDTK